MSFPFPPRLKIPMPPSPLEGLRNIVKQGRQEVEKVRNGIRSIAEDLHGGIIPRETPKKPSEEIKGEEECPVCSELADLKEYVGKRKVQKALSELEKSGDKESVETVRKYVEGEDVV